ncbi:MAG: hypothetical protein EBR82_38000 [Caulobacteraceae bacterium]|nr:hypothetical protein [Caulobacteraceae bacterium]
MRNRIGLGLATVAIGGIFASALSIAITGARSLVSDEFAGLAVLALIAALVFNRFYPRPKIESATVNSESRAIGFNIYMAGFSGGLSLILIYKGAFPDHLRIVALGSCLLTAFSVAMALAVHLHERRKGSV